MIELLGAVLASSLVGSLHCAAMCGPFVALYATGDRDDEASRGFAARLAPHLAYSGGRLAVYASLGATAGAVGAALDRVGDLVRVQRVASVVAGAMILAWGVIALLRALGVRLSDGRRTTVPGLASSALVQIRRRRRPAARAALLGLLTAALPCGWLYAFVVAAASTGSALHGAALMAVFWLGTVPMMLGLGLTLRRVARALGGRLPVIAGAALIVVGVAALVARAPMLGHLPAAPSAGAPAVPQDAPCH